MALEAACKFGDHASLLIAAKGEINVRTKMHVFSSDGNLQTHSGTKYSVQLSKSATVYFRDVCETFGNNVQRNNAARLARAAEE